jgi:hypothetical protein
VNDWLPPSQGVVQFDRGVGLEELVAVWSSLPAPNTVSPYGGIGEVSSGTEAPTFQGVPFMAD